MLQKTSIEKELIFLTMPSLEYGLKISNKIIYQKLLTEINF